MWIFEDEKVLDATKNEEKETFLETNRPQISDFL